VATDDRTSPLYEFGIVTAVLSDRIRYRSIRYKSNPPVEGEIAISGYENDAFPTPWARASMYSPWVQREQINGYNFCPVLLVNAQGGMIAIWFGKPESTYLSDNLPPSWSDGQ